METLQVCSSVPCMWPYLVFRCLFLVYRTRWRQVLELAFSRWSCSAVGSASFLRIPCLWSVILEMGPAACLLCQLAQWHFVSRGQRRDTAELPHSGCPWWPCPCSKSKAASVFLPQPPCQPRYIGGLLKAPTGGHQPRPGVTQQAGLLLCWSAPTTPVVKNFREEPLLCELSLIWVLPFLSLSLKWSFVFY